MNRPLAYGLHPVRSLLEREPAGVARLLLVDPRRPPLAELAALAAQHGITVERRPAAALDRLSGGAVHQGVLALLSAPPQALAEHALETLLAGVAQPLLLVLDEVQDPRNLGACLRSADAAGAHAVIAPRRNAAGLTAAAIKTAAGAASTVPFVQVSNLARTLRFLKGAGLTLYGADAAATGTLYQADLGVPCALVLGGEGQGLRRLTRESCDALVAIPMAGAVASLNVSVAAALCLFEAVRQRRLVDRDVGK
ncbi:MAG: 23S rRNA (guanosine(2251)-2'-O)-methyltransferase RlmB [Immundisolibacter sp.]